MKPGKTSAYDLFYNKRPYVWSLEAQWQPLWQDIEDKAQAVLQRESVGPASTREFAHNLRRSDKCRPRKRAGRIKGATHCSWSGEAHP